MIDTKSEMKLRAGDPRVAMMRASRRFYGLGWMVGTAGNLSARRDDGRIWITASGRHKGTLGSPDFVLVDPDGVVAARGLPEDRPSAETTIHLALYRLFPAAKAVYHVHTVEASVVSDLAGGQDIALPPVEMIKGLGVWDGDPRVSIPVFANQPDVPRIAAEIEQRFAANPPAVPALMIHGHGATVWGRTTEAALHHVEVLEFIFRYMVTSRLVGR
ncbi:MAG: methylthioribulose-1-phosphate dehydratase [Myxococcales bacterium]